MCDVPISNGSRLGAGELRAAPGLHRRVRVTAWEHGDRSAPGAGHVALGALSPWALLGCPLPSGRVVPGPTVLLLHVSSLSPRRWIGAGLLHSPGVCQHLAAPSITWQRPTCRAGGTGSSLTRLQITAR